MKQYFTILFYVTLFSCNSGSPEPHNVVQPSTPELTSQKKPFNAIELNDTIRVDFKTGPNIYSPLILKSIIDKIVQKGAFKPDTDKNGNIKITQDSVRTLTIGYDSAEHYFITTEYLFYNIHVKSVSFSAPRTKKNPQFKPGFLLEEWTFNTNMERDSAFNLVKYVYSHPKNIVMYDKSYPQLIKAGNRILFLKTGSDIFEKYVIKYGKLIESFVNSNYR